MSLLSGPTERPSRTHLRTVPAGKRELRHFSSDGCPHWLGVTPGASTPHPRAVLLSCDQDRLTPELRACACGTHTGMGSCWRAWEPRPPAEQRLPGTSGGGAAGWGWERTASQGGTCLVHSRAFVCLRVSELQGQQTTPSEFSRKACLLLSAASPPSPGHFHPSSGALHGRVCVSEEDPPFPTPNSFSVPTALLEGPCHLRGVHARDGGHHDPPQTLTPHHPSAPSTGHVAS